MSLRRAVGSLLTRRFSPRSLHSLRDLPIDGVFHSSAVFAAAALAGAGGTLVVQNYSKKRPVVDESAAGKVIGARKEVTHYKVKFKKPDMEDRFEHWIIKNKKAYQDEEEKAMRFQLFKATVEWIESQPPSVQETMFPEISFCADFTQQEKRRLLAYPDGFDRTQYDEICKTILAKQEEKAARKKEDDMKARFEDWTKKYNNTYRDEEEKAIRFQVFKATVEWIESQPQSAHEKLLPESYFADYTFWEHQRMTAGPVEDSKEFREHFKEFSTKIEKGESLSWRKPSVKQGDTPATQASA